LGETRELDIPNLPCLLLKNFGTEFPKISEKELMNMEALKKRRERAVKVYEILDPLYTREKTALEYRTPFQLLISTILSAQCTDKQVNQVTKTLFRKYHTPQDYMRVPISELEADIRPTGFFRNKAKSIKGCSKGIIDLYGGKVPSTMEELLKLPGVGRKTANCVLGAAFDIPGVVVDTHVKRLSQRLDSRTTKTLIRSRRIWGGSFPKNAGGGFQISSSTTGERSARPESRTTQAVLWRLSALQAPSNPLAFTCELGPRPPC
jgi:endonuclease III